MEERKVISIEVEDKPGVLTRISSLFARRGFNIRSLSVANTHSKGISRFTIVVDGNAHVLEQIRKQTQKLIHVLKTNELCPKSSIYREFALFKLEYNDHSSEHINEIIDYYGGRVLDVTNEVLIVEFSGSAQKINVVLEKFSDDIILEFNRTGKVGMKKGRDI